MNAPSKTGKAKFPTTILKAWLKGRKAWNHDDWLLLLQVLRNKGYGALTDAQEGQDQIGKFLEAYRSK